jgi:hypothetical protein
MTPWFAIALAADPTLPIQGTLSGADGAPLNGVQTVTFTLFDGSSQVWAETRAVDVVDGAFAAHLGATTPLTSVDFSADDLTITVTVGGVASDPVAVGWAARSRFASRAASAAVADELAVPYSAGDGLSLTGRAFAATPYTAGDGLSLTGRAFAATPYTAGDGLSLSGRAFSATPYTAGSGLKLVGRAFEADLDVLDDTFVRSSGGAGLSVTGAVTADSMVLRPTSTPPSSPVPGQIYVGTDGLVYIWSGTAWGPLGGSSTAPRNCTEVRYANPAAATGSYTIDPDGAGSAFSSVTVWCDMDVIPGQVLTLVGRRAAGANLTSAAGIGAISDATYKLPTPVIDQLRQTSDRWYVRGVGSTRWNAFGTRRNLPNTSGNAWDLFADTALGRGLSGCGPDAWNAGDMIGLSGIPSTSCYAYPTRNVFYDFSGNSSNSSDGGAVFYLRGEAVVPTSTTYADCTDVLQANSSARSGYYNLDLDGAGSGGPVEVFCNMDLDPGSALTLVARRQNGQTVDVAAPVGSGPRQSTFSYGSTVIDALQARSDRWYVWGAFSNRTAYFSTSGTLPGAPSNAFLSLDTLNVGRGLSGCGSDTWGSSLFLTASSGAVPSPSCWAYPTVSNFYDFHTASGGAQQQAAEIFLRALP